MNADLVYKNSAMHGEAMSLAFQVFRAFDLAEQPGSKITARNFLVLGALTGHMVLDVHSLLPRKDKAENGR